MKYEILIDSGFDSKGDIIDIEIVKEYGGIIEYEILGKNGALYNPNHHVSSELFYKKFKLASFQE